MLIWSHSEALLEWKAAQAPICLSGVTLKLFSVESCTSTYMLIWSHSEALLQWKAHRNLYASVESYTGTYMLIWSHSEALLQWKATQAPICLSGVTLKLFFSGKLTGTYMLEWKATQAPICLSGVTLKLFFNGKLHRHLYAYLESL